LGSDKVIYNSVDRKRRISALKSLIDLIEAQKVTPYKKMGECVVKYTDKIQAIANTYAKNRVIFVATKLRDNVPSQDINNE
jgi:hypothetical protein